MRRALFTWCVWLALGLCVWAQPVPPGTKVTLGAANAVAILNASQDTIITVQVQGTWTGTQTFEGSLDGSTFTATNCTPVNGTSAVTTTTANGIWSCSMIGVNFFQTRFSSFGSGAAVVSYQTAYLSGGSSGGGGAGGSVSITQGGNTAAVNGSSQLSVNCANCSGSGVSQQDNTGFVPGTTNFVPVGGEVDDVGTSTVAENSAGAARLTVQRGLHVNLRTIAGAETGVAASPLQVSLANTAANGTAVAVSAASLPLPSTAATSTKQSDGSQKTQIVDGSGNVIASTSNNLNVQCANCSGSGVSTADEASFTAGTSLFAGGGGFFQTTATNNALTNGQQGMFQVTAQRALFSNLRNASGTEVGTASTPLQVSLANTAANATAVKVDGSAVTQPVSGTVTATGTVAATQSGTWTVQPGNTANTTPWLVTGSGTAGTAASGVLTVQGIASMTKLLVTPDSVALPANQSVNVAQVNGVTTSTGVGAAGTGTQRITDVASGTTGLAPPTQASYVGGLQSGATGGFLGGITVCDSKQTISVTTNTQLITGTSGRHVYICALNLVVAAATNVALVSGTGSTCATGIAGMAGGTTAATGWNLAANGGLSQGTGIGWVMRTGATGDNVCILVSAANQTSGVLVYAIY